jgi:hypothetical protein
MWVPPESYSVVEKVVKWSCIMVLDRQTIMVKSRCGCTSPMVDRMLQKADGQILQITTPSSPLHP